MTRLLKQSLAVAAAVVVLGIAWWLRVPTPVGELAAYGVFFFVGEN